MLSTLQRYGGVLFKIGLSLIAVILFIVLSSNMPFLQEQAAPITWKNLTGTELAVSSLDTLANPTGGEIKFAGADAQFSGSFFDTDEDAGFIATEVDIDGPCELAGRRYIQQQCSDCMVTEGVTEPGQPATLFWWSMAPGNATSGTIFRDCISNVPNGQVRVPMVTFTADTLSLANGEGTGKISVKNVAAVPLLHDSERIGAMSLGDWVVTIDEVSNANTALDEMESLLQSRGWNLSGGGDNGMVKAEPNQRVYMKSGSLLCIVTLTVDDDGPQLITMTNN